jgi:GNAT superfamily N-acetyltransferase
VSEANILWIMISGPYGTGARSDAERAANLRAMNRAALDVVRRGHVPVIGVNMALPIIEADGPASYDEHMMPISLALADRCDAVLRIGGASKGADEEVERIRARGGRVYRSIDEVPLRGDWRARSLPTQDRGITIRGLATGEAAECERILRSLPDWFGIEESLRRYVADLAELEATVAIVSGEIAGFMSLRRHNSWTTEIDVIAVRPEHHGRGTGRALVEDAEARIRLRGMKFFQVKTLGPSRPSEHYDRTRHFYERMGFLPLEENDLWGPANPCLIMVKHLDASRR